ncbi:MAG: hypothetical protein AMXMBFR37_00940 [Steroidobacteraceae bacterium]
MEFESGRLDLVQKGKDGPWLDALCLRPVSRQAVDGRRGWHGGQRGSLAAGQTRQQQHAGRAAERHARKAAA